ncbi:hypothetical protein J9978_21320 [Chromobacterium violaceum]|uniref:hypothetical protein n=1 Tax=Chromobacterium violaceum TaxID=536 RepID=UPI001B32046A|nr:hypothetical protein [Chromobacterium violaceum]MBP4052021.1 hypothetical protein [Chromobacterium violaceum]MCD0494801.1 hypothetical protein [Chromobacterium violaceum]
MAESKQTTAQTKPKDLNATQDHLEDVYNLIIGFEVNTPSAYREVYVIPNGKRKVHYVLEDPGHTFMYLTKNGKITFFYSLGPRPGASTRERAYGQGTPEYKIPGETRLFRFNISEAQHNAMLAKGKAYRADVLAGERYYNIFHNFTCARSARDIIVAGWPNVPKGESFVGKGVVMDEVVNPYAFYEDIHNKYPQGEIKLGENRDQWKVLMEKGNNAPGTKDDPTRNPSSWQVKRTAHEN